MLLAWCAISIGLPTSLGLITHAVCGCAVVLTCDGDIYSWGHKIVIPRKITLSGSRDTARAAAVDYPALGGGAPGSSFTGQATDVRFHRGQGQISRPVAVAITAGVAHTSCLTRTGVVLTWQSDQAQAVVQVSSSRG